MQDNQMYPTGVNPVGARTTALGAAGTADLSLFEIINLSSTATTAVTLTNPVIGRTYYISATGTGTNDRVVTFSGCTLNETGNSVATFNAIDENLVLLCVTATKYSLISNNGVVVLSSP